MTDIAIIGAGAAGIAAARHLAALEHDFVLLEAKPHAGGRCVTDHVTLGAPVDLGAHWLHSPARNPLVEIADRYGIRYRQGAQDGRYCRNGAWLESAESKACAAYVEACFDRVMAAGQAGRDGAVTDLFTGGEDHPWYELFLAELQAKQGVAPGQCSILDFARYVWEGDDWPVIDGFGTVLARLAESLPIQYATTVERIDWSGSKDVRLTTPAGTVAARAVILTVSTGILASGIRFDPLLPDWKDEAIDGLPMGSCNKVALRFSGRVFADCNASLVLPMRGLSEPVEFMLREGEHEIATCLLNGPFGKALAKAGPAAMADYALERLIEMFGSHLRQALLPGQVTADWDADPFVRGCYAAARPGRADARADLARPVENRLFFAGEATSRDFIGDVHGAWFSGIKAAEAALASRPPAARASRLHPLI